MTLLAGLACGRLGYWPAAAADGAPPDAVVPPDGPTVVDPPAPPAPQVIFHFAEGAGAITTARGPGPIAGQLLGTVEWIGDGVVGAALRFGSSTDAEVLADDPVLRYRGDVTVSLWYRLSPAAAGRSCIPFVVLAGSQMAGAAANALFATSLTGSGLSWYHEHTPVDSTQLLLAPPVDAYAAGAWRHLVMARSSLEKAVYYYLDGQALGTRSYEFDPADGELAPLHLGQDADPGDCYPSMSGDLDEVSFYDRVLTAEEVALVHARPDAVP